MIKNIIIALLICLLLGSHYLRTDFVKQEKSQLRIEVQQRDIAIEELVTVIELSYIGSSKKDVMAVLSKASINIPDHIAQGDDYIEFKSLVKFEFKNDKLVRVFW